MTPFFRVMQLARLAKPIDTQPRVVGFLTRVSRCFLYGFDAECAIMCRAAIDSALESEISRVDPLDQRIDDACRLGRLKPETAHKAHDVCRLGSTLVARA